MKIGFEDVFKLIVRVDRVDEAGNCLRKDSRGEEDYVSNWELYKAVQHFAFALNDNNIKITEELADFLNEKYEDLCIEVENDKDIDLSGDYLMDFHRWSGKEGARVYW